MAQFDVYTNPNPETKPDMPFLLGLQSDLLDPLATRVVIPLVRCASMPQPVRHLNPVFEVLGERVVLSTAELAGVPRTALGEVVGSLSQHRDDVVRAVDFLISGI